MAPDFLSASDLSPARPFSEPEPLDTVVELELSG